MTRHREREARCFINPRFTTPDDIAFPANNMAAFATAVKRTGYACGFIE